MRMADVFLTTPGHQTRVWWAKSAGPTQPWLPLLEAPQNNEYPKVFAFLFILICSSPHPCAHTKQRTLLAAQPHAGFMEGQQNLSSHSYLPLVNKDKLTCETSRNCRLLKTKDHFIFPFHFSTVTTFCFEAFQTPILCTSVPASFSRDLFVTLLTYQRTKGEQPTTSCWTCADFWHGPALYL